MSSEKAQAGRGIASRLVDDWQATRQALKEIEKAEHPDLTDVLGRVWTWWKGDLYRHDSMARDRSMVTNPNLDGPTKQVLDNPNYKWCDICKELAK